MFVLLKNVISNLDNWGTKKTVILSDMHYKNTFAWFMFKV